MAEVVLRDHEARAVRRWVNALAMMLITAKFFRVREAQALTSVEASGRLDIGKYVLRLAFAGVIPDEILLRPKTAFPVPLDRWLYGKRLSWLKERVLTRKMGELFDLGALERALDSTRGKQEGMKLWMLANVGIWLEMYFPGRIDS